MLCMTLTPKVQKVQKALIGRRSPESPTTLCGANVVWTGLVKWWTSGIEACLKSQIQAPSVRQRKVPKTGFGERGALTCQGWYRTPSLPRGVWGRSGRIRDSLVQTITHDHQHGQAGSYASTLTRSHSRPCHRSGQVIRMAVMSRSAFLQTVPNVV